MLLRGKGNIACSVAAAVVLLVALVSGCGGSSDAAPLKQPVFVKEANAICAAAQNEREEQGKDLGPDSDGPEDADDVMQLLLEPVDKMTGEINDLGAPVGQEKQVEAIVAAYEAGIAKLEEEPESPNSVSAFNKANQLAAEFGLTDCTI